MFNCAKGGKNNQTVKNTRKPLEFQLLLIVLIKTSSLEKIKLDHHGALRFHRPITQLPKSQSLVP